MVHTRRENGSFIRGKQDLRASPRLQRKKCNGTWTSTISAPNREPSYHPPSLPQLIFHFSSGAHRMRDVSISCQSFPGLCVTCVVISVWLTGSVVSHCPAPSDSHRLTLMMRGGEALACSVVGGDDRRKKKMVDVERVRQETRLHKWQTQSPCRKTRTLQGGLKERSLCSDTIKGTWGITCRS